jgi:23S rRNA pseudouridine1911/1915/1917 synthase
LGRPVSESFGNFFEDHNPFFSLSADRAGTRPAPTFIINLSENIQKLKFTAAAGNVGVRLDFFLSENIGDWTRSRLKKLIDAGDVLVNGEQVKSSYKLREADEIKIELKETDENNFKPEDIPLDIVFEDEYLAVINKPAGMVVHPGAGISSGTLANAVAHMLEVQSSEFGVQSAGSANPVPRPGIVHRLDKDTSGLIVVAKNQITLDRLAEQFRSRTIYKSYVALVHGFVRRLTGRVDEPIARDRQNRVKMAVVKTGRNAHSVYKVRQRFEKFTLLDVQIKTGRTHQIRVHLAHINHPIIGDETYNAGRDNQIESPQLRKSIKDLNRFYLHAEKLSFTHPVSKERMDFVQPLPDELMEILKLL